MAHVTLLKYGETLCLPYLSLVMIPIADTYVILTFGGVNIEYLIIWYKF
jgi:hypothetical protein